MASASRPGVGPGHAGGAREEGHAASARLCCTPWVCQASLAGTTWVVTHAVPWGRPSMLGPVSF